MSHRQYIISSEDRCVAAAQYIIENNATVRETAKVIGVGKSTIHKDVTVILKSYNIPLYLLVRKVLDKNKTERHIRGGLATKRKFATEAAHGY
mgnify:CR=1 FL=1